MTAYKVTTTFLGADGSTEFYFSTKEKAREFLGEQQNGEIDEVEVPCLPWEGCHWNEIKFREEYGE